jgi:hypothetical protein
MIQYYPALFPISDFPDGGARFVRITCGEGWFPLIKMLCDQIQDVIDDRDLRQATISRISEKFGVMRVTCQGSSQPVRKLVEAAERTSASFCEVCGSVGLTQRTNHGWIKTLCAGCAVGASAE